MAAPLTHRNEDASRCYRTSEKATRQRIVALGEEQDCRMLLHLRGGASVIINVDSRSVSLGGTITGGGSANEG